MWTSASFQISAMAIVRTFLVGTYADVHEEPTVTHTFAMAVQNILQVSVDPPRDIFSILIIIVSVIHEACTVYLRIYGTKVYFNLIQAYLLKI